MTPTHRDKIFGKLPPDTYLWCLHCERTYLNGEYREAGGFMPGLGRMQLCPYDDCGGDAVTDAIEWEEIREEHRGYPKKPERNVIYK